MYLLGLNFVLLLLSVSGNAQSFSSSSASASSNSGGDVQTSVNGQPSSLFSILQSGNGPPDSGSLGNLENERPGLGDLRPESEDRRPGLDKQKLESENQRPESEKQKLESENRRPESEKQKLESENRKPESEKPRPESENRRPESEKPRPGADNRRPESETRRPETENQREKPGKTPQELSITEPEYGRNCIPDEKSLNITLARGGDLNRCTVKPRNDRELFSKKDFKRAPKNVEYRYAKDDEKYTLIVYGTSSQLKADYLEWVVSNIKGSDLKRGRIRGDTRLSYRRAGPVPNEGQIHEYALFSETVKNQKVHIPRSRYNFDLKYFLGQQPNRLNGPIATTNGRTRKIR